ncbi:hypothetical protein LCGC14_2457590 [marine sediment metagenome]|uniref:Uncharacterized protein n=1 Tax=marine sediment metagenome TaxID=412755 RepID=A0A0F9C1Y4_9ZZZZ
MAKFLTLTTEDEKLIHLRASAIMLVAAPWQRSCDDVWIREVLLTNGTWQQILDTPENMRLLLDESDD